ncbi:MAG: chemotaxis protein CheW [Candidatus Kariarchaeaceae archaeon]|jgi:purine-binding chemotaxis protein CheW
MSVAQQEQKYVAFKLSDEHYAIDVHQVQEVFVPSSITQIPQAQDFVAGVINFRGMIVTVIDLMKRLGIPVKVKKSTDSEFEFEDEDKFYVIIVKKGTSTVGLLVDYVESVINITRENIQATIDLISGEARTAFLSGVARTDLGLTVLLSLETILSEYDVSEVEKLARIREQISGAPGESGDEVVITSESMVDLDEDDLSATDGLEFKEVETPTGIGESPLDLNSLTKAELLKIAIEMEIDDVTTRTNKPTLVKKIQEKMGNI